MASKKWKGWAVFHVGSGVMQLVFLDEVAADGYMRGVENHYYKKPVLVTLVKGGRKR